MTAEELVRRMVMVNDYLMREHVRTIDDRYAMDPQDRAAAFVIVDMVRTGMNFTTDEALTYIKILTATV